MIRVEDQIWVGGHDTQTKLPFVYMWDGNDWVDHSPPLFQGYDKIEDLIATEGVMFAKIGWWDSDALMTYDGSDWDWLPQPPGYPAFQDIAATAADRLWVTTREDWFIPDIESRLWMWDGDHWYDAQSLFPQLSGQCCWSTLAEAGDGGLWLLSDGYAQSDQLAYYDGSDWTIVETPPKLHRWYADRPQMAAAADGLFIYDGVYVWRYAFCQAA